MPDTSAVELLLGWVGAALSAVLALPQAVALLRTRGRIRISIRPWQALLASNTAWIYYGFTTKDLPITASSMISAAISTILVIMIAARTTPRRLPLYMAQPLGVALALSLTSSLPAAFGLLTAIPSTLGWSIQAWRFHTEGRPNNFSFSGTVFYLTCQAVWLSYATIRMDWALIASTTPLIIAVAVAAALYLKTEPQSSNDNTTCHSGPPTEPTQIPHA